MTPIAGEASFIVILAPKTTNPTPFTQTSSIINLSRRMVLILYTTQYKTGGPEMARAAETMACQKPNSRAIKIESKAEFIAAVTQHGPLDELHLIGHSGLYGPMFGTTKFPEQFSRAEWRALEIPFTQNARALFHCCRGGRWFAPYFARRYQIPASGHLSYTTFSADPVRYVPVLPETADVYVVSVPGRKASGIFAAARTSGHRQVHPAHRVLALRRGRRELRPGLRSVRRRLSRFLGARRRVAIHHPAPPCRN